MIFTQYYLDCLSHASYLIGDETTGRAVVVDPRRDIDEYVRDAEADGFTIELIIETLWYRSWTADLMPQIVRDALLVQDAPDSVN